MKKKILSAVLAFTMLVSSFAGSLEFETLNGLNNLVTANSAEQTGDTLKTKFNKTLLFADDAAFDAELKRVSDELLPEYEKAAQSINTIDDVVKLLKLYDECVNALSRLGCYSDSGICLDGSNMTAIEQYNSFTNLSDYCNQITLSAYKLLKDKDEYFLSSLLTDERLKPWHNMLSDIINGSMFSEYEMYMLEPAEKARDSYESIYSTLIDTDLVYESVTAPDGSEIEANLTNSFSAGDAYDDSGFQKKVLEAYYQSLKNYENTFAGLLNSYISSSESLAQRYGYSSVLQMSAASDGITPDAILNLINSGRQNTGIFVRYMKMENRAYGYDSENPDAELKPVFEVPDVSFKYENAREILVKALAPLGDEYISILNKAFDEGWIDVYPDDNKVSGGLTLSYAGAVPCVIINYTDDYNSLSTLAHELGHAIHDYLSSTNQTSCYCSQPTSFTSEIASLTNELLLVRYLEDNAKTDNERLYYYMEEFNVYNVNFFGNLVTTDFEYEIRNVVNSGGVLTAQKLDDTFERILHVYYPDSAAMKNRDVSWIYISQLYSPYYSKSYGFAVSAAANATNNILSGNQKATDNYITFLKAGSSREPNELYALVGTNLTDPSFVQPFFDRCNKIIDESEAIITKSAK